MKPNRAVVALLVIVLALATALTLVGTAVTLAHGPSGSNTEDENLAVVRRFYAAVNTAIATGELGDLDAVVSPAARIGAAESGGEGGLPRLREHLRALHAARPGLWVRVEEAIAAGDQVVVRVAFDGLGTPVGPDGLIAVAAAESPLWVAGDRFRVVDGRIVAFDGITLALAPTRPLLDATVQSPAAGQAWLGLARLTVAPQARAEAQAGIGPTLYAVETGSVAVRLTSGDGTGEEERLLRPGDQLAIPAGTHYTLRNPSAAAASLLTAALVSPSLPWPPRFTTPIEPMPASDVVTIAPELRTQLPPETVATAAPVMSMPLPAEIDAISLGGASVAPGRLGLSGSVRVVVGRLEPATGTTRLDLATGGPSLVAVEAGQALLSATGAGADLVAPAQATVATPRVDGRPTVVLGAGQAALAESGTSVAVQVAGAQPLSLLVLTIDAA